MATPKTFNDETLLRTALYNLLENDTELFNAIIGATLNASEWLVGSWSPTFIDLNQFTLPGDQTEAYAPGRRVRAHLSTEYVYSHVVEVSFSSATGNSTITLADDVLNGTLDEVALGIISSRPTSSLPVEKDLVLPPIYLVDWQTNDNEYTVEIKDIANSDEHGADSFYQYVFRGNVSNIMYREIGPIPFSGYDLQFNYAYRMTTTDLVNTVNWGLGYKAISDGNSDIAYANYAAFSAAKDAFLDFQNTASSANTLNIVTGNNLVIPHTAYAKGDILKLMLARWSNGGHAGHAEIKNTIYCLPVLP